VFVDAIFRCKVYSSDAMHSHNFISMLTPSSTTTAATTSTNNNTNNNNVNTNNANNNNFGFVTNYRDPIDDENARQRRGMFRTTTVGFHCLRFNQNQNKGLKSLRSLPTTTTIERRHQQQPSPQQQAEREYCIVTTTTTNDSISVLPDPGLYFLRFVIRCRLFCCDLFHSQNVRVRCR
jgi:hypothetical protein